MGIKLCSLLITYDEDHEIRGHVFLPRAARAVRVHFVAGAGAELLARPTHLERRLRLLDRLVVERDDESLGRVGVVLQPLGLHRGQRLRLLLRQLDSRSGVGPQRRGPRGNARPRLTRLCRARPAAVLERRRDRGPRVPRWRRRCPERYTYFEFPA